MKIRSLSDTNFETIFLSFSEAFADYEMQLNADEFKSMCERRGFDPDLSFAAFDGDRIVAFTLNGTGHFNGLKMAYDTGTATVKDYRGKGLATKIFEHSIPFLKAADINHYLLEVLQHNRTAVSVYQKIGFEVTREFNYFVWQNEALKNEHEQISSGYEICFFDPFQYELLSSFWDFNPSWQNSFQSISRSKCDFVNLGICAGGNLLGYCIFEPVSGDIAQIAVDKGYRRKGIGSLLLREACKHNKHQRVKMINVETSCNSITGFLSSKNIGITGKQFEMILKL